MPNCYLLAVSHGSALDQYTNTFTLFSLIEEMKIEYDQSRSPEPPTTVPFEVHVYWYLSPDEFGVEFEWRLIFMTSEAIVPIEKVFELKSTTARHRFRVGGFPILATGQLELRVEWREKGAQEWNRCGVFWPLGVEMVPTSGVHQP
jgi:hypothetical protein